MYREEELRLKTETLADVFAAIGFEAAVLDDYPPTILSYFRRGELERARAVFRELKRKFGEMHRKVIDAQRLTRDIEVILR